jgi:predicted metal-binding membrane protein
MPHDKSATSAPETGYDLTAPAPAAKGAKFALPGFYFVWALIFLSAAAMTVWFNHTMSMTMPMPGGWSMSMMWMEVASGSPGQFLVFIVMWVAMMVAMMLPSTFPMLLLYRRVARFRGDSYLNFRVWLVGAGYFAAWAGFGGLVCLLGALVSRLAMASTHVSQAIPLVGGVALMAAGGYQLTPWKSACLRHCQDPVSLLSHHLGEHAESAFKLGLHHGAYCTGCCWGLMLIQLVLGVMNIYVMVVIALVIALEKLLPSGKRLAHGTGIAAILIGTALAGASLREVHWIL